MKASFELYVRSQQHGAFALEVHELDPNTRRGLFGEPNSVLLGRLEGEPLEHALDTVRAWLRELGHKPSVLTTRRNEPIALDEDHGVRLSLLFGALGPLERADRIAAICDGIGRMTREEALYWHGKARHIGRGRALKALRVLLADEPRSNGTEGRGR